MSSRSRANNIYLTCSNVTTEISEDLCAGSVQMRGGDREGDEGGGRRCTSAPSYCGRAFRMAFTSSATAVSANSNWSCSEMKEGKQREAVKKRGKKEVCLHELVR